MIMYCCVLRNTLPTASKLSTYSAIVEGFKVITEQGLDTLCTCHDVVNQCTSSERRYGVVVRAQLDIFRGRNVWLYTSICTGNIVSGPQTFPLRGGERSE